MFSNKECIQNGNAILGIELGSTRIKTVLLNSNYDVISTGSFDWENHLINNIWTYPLDEVWMGIQQSYKSMSDDVKSKFGISITNLKSIGISAMMHGYITFDKNNNLLVPFRTWRNTNTIKAAEELTNIFSYNVPQRWSSAHFYQSILDNEDHVHNVDYFTTLSGYIHWQLTGEKVLGIGDASGMFPVDIKTKTYYTEMLAKFNGLAKNHGVHCDLVKLMPKVLCAGEYAGKLTIEGCKKLDISGNLQYGIPMCPPEGDAGTGMVATNSVAVRTGNISAGTSIFAMVVLEKELKKVHPEIDMVTTPSGELVAMAHANNCTSDLNAWVSIFGQFAKSAGINIDQSKLFSILYSSALSGENDCGGLLSYGFLSGENMLPVHEGRPLFVRMPNSNFTLNNFMRSHLFAALGTTRIGLDILTDEEGVELDCITGHGGLFKTPIVGQKLMAGALNTPIKILKTAGEGGAWGIAVLAAYLAHKKDNETLSQFLEEKIFKNQDDSIIEPDENDVIGFNLFMKKFKDGLDIEIKAIDCLN